MKKHYKLWRFLFDINLVLTGVVGTKHFMFGNEYAFLYLISAVLLIIVDQLDSYTIKNAN